MDLDINNEVKKTKTSSEFLQNLKKLSPMQMFSVISMLLLGLTIPVTIFMAMSPITPTITPAKEPSVSPEKPTTSTIGHAPVIITTDLETVSSGKQYSQTVEGYDLDTGDELTFQVDGLPSGLTIDQCYSEVRIVKEISKDNINHLSCTITGITDKYGEFNVKLTLIDGFNFTQRTLALIVQ